MLRGSIIVQEEQATRAAAGDCLALQNIFINYRLPSDIKSALEYFRLSRPSTASFNIPWLNGHTNPSINNRNKLSRGRIICA